MASEFRQEEEREEDDEDDTCSVVDPPPTLSPLFGGLMLVGLLGDRSWDEVGLGTGRFLRSHLTLCRICLREKCVTSALEVEESDEYRSDTWRRSVPEMSSLLRLRISTDPLPILRGDPLSTTGFPDEELPTAHRSGCSCSRLTTTGSTFGDTTANRAAPPLG